MMFHNKPFQSQNPLRVSGEDCSCRICSRQVSTLIVRQSQHSVEASLLQTQLQVVRCLAGVNPPFRA